jgi:hypothetical protein
MYDILPYTYKKAEELGVKIFPSGNTKYKVEVYDWNGNFRKIIKKYLFLHLPPIK